MKITKSHLKRIIKEELNRVQIEKLVHMVLNHPIFSAAQYLLPKSLISSIREEMVSFLYENQDIAEEAWERYWWAPPITLVNFVMEYVVKPFSANILLERIKIPMIYFAPAW